MTYRYRGHSVADAGKAYRTAEEIESWRKRDPIDRFASLLVEQGVLDQEAVDEVWKEAADEVRRAIDEALAADSPDVGSLYEHVYGDPEWEDQFARMEPGAPFGERKGTRAWRR
jgi:TPP-dependent pyruvate/acetoin dehydrogenase alpha subunit